MEKFQFDHQQNDLLRDRKENGCRRRGGAEDRWQTVQSEKPQFVHIWRPAAVRFSIFLLGRCEACEEDVGSPNSDPGGGHSGQVGLSRKEGICSDRGLTRRWQGGRKKVQQNFSWGGFVGLCK